MATNKMRLRHAYRAGGDDFLEQNYGIRFDKDDKNLSRQITQSIVEDEEIKEALKKEEEKPDDLLQKMEYMETLDINQLRNIAKSTLGIPHKNLMKMKKEELISELLK
jgi:hypothetical protein